MWCNVNIAQRGIVHIIIIVVCTFVLITSIIRMLAHNAEPLAHSPLAIWAAHGCPAHAPALLHPLHISTLLHCISTCQAAATACLLLLALYIRPELATSGTRESGIHQLDLH